MDINATRRLLEGRGRVRRSWGRITERRTALEVPVIVYDGGGVELSEMIKEE